MHVLSTSGVMYFLPCNEVVLRATTKVSVAGLPGFDDAGARAAYGAPLRLEHVPVPDDDAPPCKSGISRSGTKSRVR